MTLAEYYQAQKIKALKNNKLKFFNTIGRLKEIFKPLKKGQVGFYACGPTVYNYAHIGNLRSYIFSDTLRRTLLFNNLKVKQIMNITDVGHLASDSDTGEDKMLLGAKREKKKVTQIAEFYTKAFKDDLKHLNILDPTKWTKATDHIKEMIAMIKKIEKNGFTYEANGNIYFDVMKFNKKYKYDTLANIKFDDTESRVEIDKNKKSKFDFVLWFTKSKFQDQEQKWDSSYGLGYPGWHIECSAMSTKYLGKEFDIHTGGVDHIPIHHTNEVAQCYGAYGKLFAKLWMHGEFLVIDKNKMGKSRTNFITLATLIDKGYDPLAYRYFNLNSHYRQQLNFSYKALNSAKSGFNRLKTRIIDLKNKVDQRDFNNIKLKKEEKQAVQMYLDKFVNAINDDLNMPKALSLAWDILKDLKISDETRLFLLLEFDNVYGLDFKNMKEEVFEIPNIVVKLAEQRKKARLAKDWIKSDELRDKIQARGFLIADDKEGNYKISRMSP